VDANASDNVGVVGVQFKRDGANLGAEDTSAPYSIDWNTATASNGGHSLTAVARDAAGHKTTSAARPVTVSNVAAAPSVWLTAPAAGATVSGRTTLSAAANDNLSVAGMRFLVDGNVLGVDTQKPYSLVWDTTSVANGAHKLTAVAADPEGNTQSSAALGVTVANSPKGSPPPPDNAPAITHLKLSSSSFRKSTTIRFRLSEAAKVTLSFERKLRGHKRRGKCVTSTRKGARCTLYRKLSTKVTVNGSAGTNALRLGRRGMRAGSYRLTLVATDASGKRSAKLRAGFTLIGAASHSSRSAAVEAAIRSVQLAF
jgi:hypothetical protein